MSKFARGLFPQTDRRQIHSRTDLRTALRRIARPDYITERKMNELIFTNDEKKEALALTRKLRSNTSLHLKDKDVEKVFRHLKKALKNNLIKRNVFGLNPVLESLQTALIAVEEIGLKRDGVMAILLYAGANADASDAEDIRLAFGDTVARIIHGLCKIQELYKKNPVIRRRHACDTYHDSRQGKSHAADT